MTMIFPSPDWFLGFSNVDMCDPKKGEWRENLTRDLFPYDSGTDDGTSFESDDSVSNPRKNIFLIGKDDETNFRSDSSIRRLGTVEMKKVLKPIENNGDNDNQDENEVNNSTPAVNGGDNGNQDENGVNSASSVTGAAIMIPSLSVIFVMKFL